MLEFLGSLPPWAFKLGAVLLAVVLVGLSGLGLGRLYHKLTDRMRLE